MLLFFQQMVLLRSVLQLSKNKFPLASQTCLKKKIHMTLQDQSLLHLLVRLEFLFPFDEDIVVICTND